MIVMPQSLYNIVCSFVITPFGEIGLTQRLLLRIEITGTSTTAQTLKTNDGIVDAIVTFRSREEQVNGSLCQISSLEVYRGRDQAIEISHQGFSLSDNGTIEVYCLVLTRGVIIIVLATANRMILLLQLQNIN